MPIDAKSLPEDPSILKQMLVDVTAQLDKTNKLLRQLLEAKHHVKSEQLSPDQLQLFMEELKRSKGDGLPLDLRRAERLRSPNAHGHPRSMKEAFAAKNGNDGNDA